MFENPNYPKGDWRRYSTITAAQDAHEAQKKLDTIRGEEILAKAEAEVAEKHRQEDAQAEADQSRREAEIKARLRQHYTGTEENFERAWTAIRAMNATNEAAEFLRTAVRTNYQK